MEQPAAKSASVPADRSAPIQPVTERAPAVPEMWLEEKDAPSTERLDRLVEDYNLISLLALEGFQGAKYDYFATELAKYGVAVISGWMRRRMIFAKCRDRGYGGLPEPPARAFDDPDVVEELAGETVAIALDRFRTDVLMKHKWDHHRGASLRTYFIGQCLLRFANVYRTWWTAEVRHRQPSADHETLDALDRRRMPGVDELVADQTVIASARTAIKDPRVRLAMVYVSWGYKYSEIGQKLGVSEKAVERMIANERARIRARGIA
jgi:hypothetical protein